MEQNRCPQLHGARDRYAVEMQPTVSILPLAEFATGDAEGDALLLAQSLSSSSASHQLFRRDQWILCEPT